MPIFAVPIGRPGRDQPCDRAGLLLIGPIQGDRGRILMEPGGRDSIDVQGIECDGAKDAIELCGKQRLQDLPQPIIMQGYPREAGLEQGDHPTLLQACSHLIQGMMTIENRQEQGLHATATREHMGGVGRAEGIDERRHVELTYDPQHQRQMGHGTDLLNRHRHEAPFLQGFREGVS
jgi:hypothetical protein